MYFLVLVFIEKGGGKGLNFTYIVHHRCIENWNLTHSSLTKDMYITHNYGTRLENGETDQNNPSLVDFQNLNQDPDFAGECIADYWTFILY